MNNTFDFLGCLLDVEVYDNSGFNVMKVRKVNTFFWKDLKLLGTMMDKMIYDVVIHPSAKINIISFIHLDEVLNRLPSSHNLMIF